MPHFECKSVQSRSIHMGLPANKMLLDRYCLSKYFSIYPPKQKMSDAIKVSGIRSHIQHKRESCDCGLLGCDLM